MRENKIISESESNELFLDVLKKTMSKELDWNLLNVAYTTKYNNKRLYIYKGEKDIAVMLCNSHEEIYFIISKEQFMKFYFLISKKQLGSKKQIEGIDQ